MSKHGAVAVVRQSLPAALKFVVHQIKRAGVTAKEYEATSNEALTWRTPPLCTPTTGLDSVRNSLHGRDSMIEPLQIVWLYCWLMGEKRAMSKLLRQVDETEIHGWNTLRVYVNPLTEEEKSLGIRTEHSIAVALAAYQYANFGGTLDCNDSMFRTTLFNRSIGIVNGKPCGYTRVPALSQEAFQHLLYGSRLYPVVGIPDTLKRLRNLLHQTPKRIGHFALCDDLLAIEGIRRRIKWTQNSVFPPVDWLYNDDVLDQSIQAVLNYRAPTVILNRLQDRQYMSEAHQNAIREAKDILDVKDIYDRTKFIMLEELLVPHIVSATEFRSDICGRQSIVGAVLYPDLKTRIIARLSALAIEQGLTQETLKERLSDERYRESGKYEVGQWREIQRRKTALASDPPRNDRYNQEVSWDDEFDDEPLQVPAGAGGIPDADGAAGSEPAA